MIVLVSQHLQATAKRYISGCGVLVSPAMATCLQNVRSNKSEPNSFHTTAVKPKQSHSVAHKHIDNRIRAFSSNPDPKVLQKEGIFDERNLLVFDTLHEMQTKASIAFASNPLFGTYRSKGDGGKGEFEWMSSADFGKKVLYCRTVLYDLGVKEFSKVGIISNNRWEWAAIACASYSLNATLVPTYEAQMPSDWAYILNDSGCVALFCATKDIYDRAMEQVVPQTPSVKATLCIDAPSTEQNSFHYHMESAARKSASSPVCSPSPDDLANLVYTSGTTGKPKGVELLHSNTVSNVKGVRNMVEDVHDFIRHSDRSLAFLPWAHSYGQTCELWIAMSHGGSMGIGRGVPFILEDLQLVKPSVLFAVPTLFKRVYDGVNNLMETASPIRKMLMKVALDLGRRNTEFTNGGQPMGYLEKMQFKALDRIVLSKIRNRFGGNLRHGFVAGAACPSEIINFMDDIGIPICEGYGLTETSPIISINTPIQRKAGSVGHALPDVHVIIIGEDGYPVGPGKEGEICCYGPNVMRGYYKKPDATNEVITLAPDGKSRLFHTGDLGCVEEGGWVKITGRLKEQYKLENGKYVCPTPIEEAVTMSRFINQAVLCGANRPYNVVLLVPDWVAIRSELKIREDVSEEELVNDGRVKALIDNLLHQNCSKLKKFEIPQQWAFVAPFTAANNMLTPKMSIRRHMVIRTYEDVIASMYGDDPVVTPSSDGVHKNEKVA